MHDTPSSRFILPVKTILKSTLLRVAPGMTDLDVSFDSVERDRSRCASILISGRSDPSFTRADERPRGGFTGSTWEGDDGRVWARHLRLSTRIVFEVRIVAPTLAEATETLFSLAAECPRSTFDGHLLAGVAVQPPGFEGNSIELSPFSFSLPEDTTSAAKSYRSTLFIRADGGIYADRISGVSVAGRIVPTGFVQP